MQITRWNPFCDYCSRSHRIPLETMPIWMQKIINVFPMAQGIQLMKATFLGLPIPNLCLPILVMTAVGIICIQIAVSFFKWESSASCRSRISNPSRRMKYHHKAKTSGKRPILQALLYVFCLSNSQQKKCGATPFYGVTPHFIFLT